MAAAIPAAQINVNKVRCFNMCCYLVPAQLDFETKIQFLSRSLPVLTGYYENIRFILKAGCGDEQARALHYLILLKCIVGRERSTDLPAAGEREDINECSTPEIAQFSTTDMPSYAGIRPSGRRRFSNTSWAGCSRLAMWVRMIFASGFSTLLLASVWFMCRIMVRSLWLKIRGSPDPSPHVASPDNGIELLLPKIDPGACQ